MRQLVESYIRALENNTLDVWHAGHDLKHKKIAMEEYRRIVGKARIRNRSG